MDFSSKVVHVGVCTDRRTGAISTPIYQTATFRHPGLGESTGYDYTRTQNPTRQVAEEALAALEGGAAGLLFASGMAAITNVLLLYQSGDHLIVSEDCYGGTYRVLAAVFRQFGLAVSFVDTSSLTAIEAARTAATKAILVESPTNPLLKIADIRAIAAWAAANGLTTIVDNTFMTPYLQRPLELGADIVVHSGTKYLAGHNDFLCGVVVAREAAVGQRLRFLQNATGSILGPQDCWLLLRSLKTLAIRMERHQSNAGAVAAWLTQQQVVRNVYYPGLAEHPGRAVLEAQASGYGGMLAFTVDSIERVQTVLRRVQLLRFAESLGGVESLITLPAVQTHADIPVEIRAQLGITDTLLRLSIGIEAPEDIIADLAQALA